MTTVTVYWFVGIGLIILGGCSGTALFLRAIRSPGTNNVDDKAKGTLWGLFIIGVLSGLILLGAAR